MSHADPVAIVGIGCRFPGADGPEAFWSLLARGVDAIREVPADRWNIDELYDSDPTAPGKMNTRWGGFLADIDRFDAAFFGIAPREAAHIDPQQRLLLEVAWSAMEDAGLPPDSVAGQNVGVFVGMSSCDYGHEQLARADAIRDGYALTGSALSIGANRLSYVFDFRGPSLVIDTACSSSLVATYAACQSLQRGECRIALAGGVNLVLSPAVTIAFSKLQAMAPDGRCKAFDARANGFVRGEGAGIVVLKPLATAVSDGDRIYAVIRGGAINQDGRTNGLTAPNGLSQEALLREAFSNAGVRTSDIQYVEAHGTGTTLGDPIELNALGAALAGGRPRESRCAVGSVKTNIGHLESAAGVAGLIKLTLSIAKRQLVPSLHYETPNPYIRFDVLPLRVVTALEPWPVESDPARGGVSAFGFGGTNVHLVLEEAPPRDTPSNARASAACLLPISARTEPALRSLVRAYVDQLADGGLNVALADICASAAVRRSHHDVRLAAVATSRADMARRLEAYLAGDTPADVEAGRRAARRRLKVAFVFPGLGSHWLGMGRELLDCEPVFASAIAECDAAIAQQAGWSLVEELRASPERSRLEDASVVQPAIFAVQVALSALWQSWRIKPDAVIGHSMGEVAAAHVAGALSLEDAARIICHRSRLVRRASGQGAMAVVELSLAQSAEVLTGYENRLAIAVSNSPTSTVLSGEPGALDEILAGLERTGVFCRRIKADYASHSPQMDLLRDDLASGLVGLSPRRTRVPWYSTVTGAIQAGPESGPEYWARNLREPVLFANVIESVLRDGIDIFLEISPHPILVPAVQQCLSAWQRDGLALGSLRRDRAERQSLLATLASLYAIGKQPEWAALCPPGYESVRLPTYPWQRERHWFSAAEGTPAVLTRPNVKAIDPLIGDRGETVGQATGAASETRGAPVDAERHNVYCVAWEERPSTGTASGGDRSGCVVILADSTGVAARLAEHVAARGARPVLVARSAARQNRARLIAEGCCEIDPRRPDDYVALLDALSQAGVSVAAAVHLWSLDVAEDADEALALGWDSGLHLARALAGSPTEAHPRLWLATRGAQHVLDGDVVSPFRAATWGLARAIAKDYPALACSSIDLGQAGETEVAACADEIWGTDREQDVALRDGTRFVARLRPEAGPAAPYRPAYRPVTDVGAAPDMFTAELEEPGNLSRVAFRRVARRRPAPGDVEIEVLAVGLNFGDILFALGLLPSDGVHALGVECCGRLSAVGSDVTGWSIGDEVVALARPSLSSRVHARASLIARKPSGLDVEEAATLPIAVLTAYYSLHHLARLQSRERVLIHSASGAVGIACIRTAQAAGAEIFATAGTDEKRRFLEGLGVRLVMDSRSLAFADDVMRATGGLGVDVVVNSLAGDAVARGLGLLGPGGRFVELGRRGVLEGAQIPLQWFQDDRRFFLVDLAGMASKRSEACGTLLRRALQHFEDKTLEPPPRRVFPVADLADALHHMARARHIGKVVVRMDPRDVTVAPPTDVAACVRDDSTYVVTDGLGASAFLVGGWLVEKGARCLVLVCRGEPTSEDRDTVAAMMRAGAHVVVERLDWADAGAAAAAFERWAEDLPSIRGIVHAAPAPGEWALQQSAAARVRAVIAEARNVHRLSLPSPLDFLCLLSSAESLLGEGEPEDATAHEVFDALAHHRREQRLPAASIGVGPAAVGRAGPHDGRGIARLSPAQVLGALERALLTNVSHASVMTVDWRVWRASCPAVAERALFAELEGAAPREVKAESADERVAMLADRLRQHVAGVLRLPVSQIDLEQPLAGLGIDSLMAIELKSRVERELGIAIPLLQLIRGAGLSDLARTLAVSMAVDTTGPIDSGRPNARFGVGLSPSTVSSAASDGRR
jgi:acyl transferase domain-containing protein/acyl carrier protein